MGNYASQVDECRSDGLFCGSGFGRSCTWYECFDAARVDSPGDEKFPCTHRHEDNNYYRWNECEILSRVFLEGTETTEHKLTDLVNKWKDWYNDPEFTVSGTSASAAAASSSSSSSSSSSFLDKSTQEISNAAQAKQLRSTASRMSFHESDTNPVNGGNEITFAQALRYCQIECDAKYDEATGSASQNRCAGFQLKLPGHNPTFDNTECVFFGGELPPSDSEILSSWQSIANGKYSVTTNDYFTDSINVYQDVAHLSSNPSATVPFVNTGPQSPVLYAFVRFADDSKSLYLQRKRELSLDKTADGHWNCGGPTIMGNQLALDQMSPGSAPPECWGTGTSHFDPLSTCDSANAEHCKAVANSEIYVPCGDANAETSCAADEKYVEQCKEGSRSNSINDSNFCGTGQTWDHNVSCCKDYFVQVRTISAARGALTPGMEIALDEDEGAGGGLHYYISVPLALAGTYPANYDSCFLAHDDDTTPQATFKIFVTMTDAAQNVGGVGVQLWGEVRSEGASNEVPLSQQNSFCVRMTNPADGLLVGGTAKEYSWIPASTSWASAEPGLFFVLPNPGVYTLTIFLREPGSQLRTLTLGGNAAYFLEPNDVSENPVTATWPTTSTSSTTDANSCGAFVEQQGADGINLEQECEVNLCGVLFQNPDKRVNPSKLFLSEDKKSTEKDRVSTCCEPTSHDTCPTTTTTPAPVQTCSEFDSGAAEDAKIEKLCWNHRCSTFNPHAPLSAGGQDHLDEQAKIASCCSDCAQDDVDENCGTANAVIGGQHMVQHACETHGCNVDAIQWGVILPDRSEESILEHCCTQCAEEGSMTCGEVEDGISNSADKISELCSSNQCDGPDGNGVVNNVNRTAILPDPSSDQSKLEHCCVGCPTESSSTEPPTTPTPPMSVCTEKNNKEDCNAATSEEDHCVWTQKKQLGSDGSSWEDVGGGAAELSCVDCSEMDGKTAEECHSFSSDKCVWEPRSSLCTAPEKEETTPEPSSSSSSTTTTTTVTSTTTTLTQIETNTTGPPVNATTGPLLPLPTDLDADLDTGGILVLIIAVIAGALLLLLGGLAFFCLCSGDPTATSANESQGTALLGGGPKGKGKGSKGNIANVIIQQRKSAQINASASAKGTITPTDGNNYATVPATGAPVVTLEAPDEKTSSAGQGRRAARNKGNRSAASTEQATGGSMTGNKSLKRSLLKKQASNVSMGRSGRQREQRKKSKIAGNSTLNKADFLRETAAYKQAQTYTPQSPESMDRFSDQFLLGPEGQASPPAGPTILEGDSSSASFSSSISESENSFSSFPRRKSSGGSAPADELPPGENSFPRRKSSGGFISAPADELLPGENHTKNRRSRENNSSNHIESARAPPGEDSDVGNHDVVAQKQEKSSRPDETAHGDISRRRSSNNRIHSSRISSSSRPEQEHVHATTEPARSDERPQEEPASSGSSSDVESSTSTSSENEIRANSKNTSESESEEDDEEDPKDNTFLLRRR
ncbi:unnamed protein product [Amoebophrya sp. A120]|nr:unnamed protein product [Amoebophrya sp. A120]|eukprot:GSA120T00008722001.1